MTVAGWLILIGALATFRVTRLIVQDYLTETPRKWLQAHLPEKLSYLIGCPWCASFYVGAAVALTLVAWPDNRAINGVLIALAFSTVTGLIATHLDPPEDFGEPIEVAVTVAVTDDEPADG